MKKFPTGGNHLTSKSILHSSHQLNVQRQHSFERISTAFKNCRCCKSFHASVSETFPESKQNQHKYKGPFSDINNTSRHHVPKKAQPTKGELIAVGQMIFSTCEKTCKENLGKPFSEVLLAVPELNLQEKQSPYKKKKQRLKSQRQSKASVEATWSKTDINAHE